VHYHWFEINDVQSLIGIFWKTFWLILYKLIGGKLVWTIHNENPHLGNFKLLNNIFRRMMAHLADKLHVHCKEAVKIMSEIFNVDEGKFFIHEHPNFPAEIIDREKAMQELITKYPEIKIISSDKIFLMFGNIAEYKGIKETLKIFNGFSGNHKLIIAGTVKKGSEAYFDELKKNIIKKDSIFLIGKKIPDKDIPLFFCSADFALFNYKDILTSGVVYLALSYNKKIITSPKGCLKELSGKNIIFFDEQNPLKNIIQQI
jgi:beta-1,4-mannosyltransferase